MIQLKNATQEVVTDVEEHHTRRIVSSVDATSHLKSTEQSSLSVIANRTQQRPSHRQPPTTPPPPPTRRLPQQLIPRSDLSVVCQCVSLRTWRCWLEAKQWQRAM
jgi:hypothetical protein